MAKLPDNFVQTVVTSPPYWNLRDYQADGQIGLENSVAEFVEVMVDVFRSVRRVLRDDGTVWLNLGDSYGATGGDTHSGFNDRWSGRETEGDKQRATGKQFKTIKERGIKRPVAPKNLLGVPWMVAFALQADGWILRQDIIWHKPNPMPESVRDRCTKAHEYIFLLSKSPRYFYDAYAIKEPVSGTAHDRGKGLNPKAMKVQDGVKSDKLGRYSGTKQNPSFAAAVSQLVENRNKRSVWTVGSKPYRGAHFATFPPELIKPCIAAGTSEAGACVECGAPYVRVVESERVATRPGGSGKTHRFDDSDGNVRQLVGNRDRRRHVVFENSTGFLPQCDCERNYETRPCVVLDPFNGSGTTGLVAREAGCDYVGIDLNREYLDLSCDRLRQGMLF